MFITMEPKKDQIKDPSKAGTLTSNNSQVVNASISNSTPIRRLIPDTVPELSYFYIFVGLSAIIILIFVLRAMRFKSKKTSRIRRYGVKTVRGDVEMMPLDNEDDDEDATVFDITEHSSPQP